MTLSSSNRPILNFIFSLFSISLFGQEIQKYTGPKTIESYSGFANYQYFLHEKDTVLDGAFEMRKSNLGALLTDADRTFSFKGHFHKDQATGLWNFDFGEFKSDSLTEVVGLQYKINVHGIIENAKGNLKMGKPNGKWLYTRNQVKNSEISKILFESTIEFDNGVPQKSFKIKNTDGTLVGRFLRDGLAHDEWTFYSEKEVGKSQSWFFDNGKLTKISADSAGQHSSTKLKETHNTYESIINLDRRFIKIIGLQDTIISKILSGTNGIPSLLGENADYYKKLDAILTSLGEASFLPEFKVKVAHYPLDSIELNNLKAIHNSYQYADSISKSLLNDTQLNILKLSDKEANYFYSIVDTVSKSYLQPIKNIITLSDENTIEFIERSSLISRFFPSGLPSKEIKTKVGEESFLATSADSYNFSEKNLNGVLQLTKYAEASLSQIEKILGAKLAKEKRQQEFIAIEEQMISQINNLNKVIDSLDSQFPNKLLDALEQIKSVANKNLSIYSKMQNLEEKLSFGHELSQCFEELEQLEKEILLQPTKNQEIKEHYQDQVWNPFMANLMTEEVKKRITGAHRKVIMPYLINEISSNLNCDNTASLISLFKTTYNRMMALRTEDTNKLERKLKREQDPNEIMQLLNINPQVKKEQ